jgi:iron complex transport system substrate-binding protein
VVVACGGDDGGATSAPGTAPAQATGDATSSPTVIEHAFGTTTIGTAPQRLVVVGYKEQDYFLALGTVPVGIREWFGGQPSAVWPWAQSYLNGAAPVALPRELDYEQIAVLEPDLIVGLTAGMSQEEYDLLAAIAPTVPQLTSAGDYEASWQELARTAGRIVGKEPQAEELVVALEARIAAVADRYPQFQGATAILASAYEGAVYLYNSSATALKVLTSLGLTVPAPVDAITDTADQFFVVSAERFDLLEADLAVWSEGIADPGVQAVLAEPLYQLLDVHRERREVFLGEANGAFVFSSVLSLPYVLDVIVPELALAIDGDPATASSMGAP